MTEIWEVKELGDICEIARGGSPRPIQQFITNDPGGVNWIKISDATASGKYIYSTKEKITREGVQRSRMVNEGDFILSNSMSFGRPYIMKTSGCIHDGWLVLSDKKRVFDQDYLYYFLGSDIAYRQFDSLAAGSTVRNLNIESAKRVKVPLPPVDQQKRIAAILDEAFAAIAAATANAEKNLANAHELFESALSCVLATNSEEWPERKLEEIVEATCTLSYGIVQPGEEVADGLPIVRPTDLYRHLIELNGLKRIDPALAEGYSRTKLVGDELLLCVRGSTGVISIASSELAGGNVTRGIVPVRFSPSFVSQKLGYYLFLSKYVQDQIRSATYGTALMQINIRDLRRLSFILPPLDAQPGLLRELESVSRNVQCLKQLYEQKLTVLAELKQSILQKAFSGELTTLPHHALQHAAE